MDDVTRIKPQPGRAAQNPRRARFRHRALSRRQYRRRAGRPRCRRSLHGYYRRRRTRLPRPRRHFPQAGRPRAPSTRHRAQWLARRPPVTSNALQSTLRWMMMPAIVAISKRPHPSRVPGPLMAALVLLAISAFINYIDRGNLSIAAPLLKDELGISPSKLGILLSAFFWTYACSQLFSGWLVDRLNVNWVFATGFILWSSGHGLDWYRAHLPGALRTAINPRY